jgi:hypothetical protein
MIVSSLVCVFTTFRSGMKILPRTRRWIYLWSQHCEWMLHNVNSKLIMSRIIFGALHLSTSNNQILLEHIHFWESGRRPPLWSSCQSSWLQIQRFRIRFLALRYFLRSSGSGTGTTQPLSTIEELFGRKSSGFGLENREYGFRDPSRWPRGTLYTQKLTVTSPTSPRAITRLEGLR